MGPIYIETSNKKLNNFLNGPFLRLTFSEKSYDRVIFNHGCQPEHLLKNWIY